MNCTPVRVVYNLLFVHGILFFLKHVTIEMSGCDMNGCVINWHHNLQPLFKRQATVDNKCMTHVRCVLYLYMKETCQEISILIGQYYSLYDLHAYNAAESRYFEPPGEMKIGFETGKFDKSGLKFNLT